MLLLYCGQHLKMTTNSPAGELTTVWHKKQTTQKKKPRLTLSPVPCETFRTGTTLSKYEERLSCSVFTLCSPSLQILGGSKLPEVNARLTCSSRPQQTVRQKQREHFNASLKTLAYLMNIDCTGPCVIVSHLCVSIKHTCAPPTYED